MRSLVILAAALTTFGAASCKSREEAPAPPVASAPARSDHLDPNELLEGKEKAFALPLPRDLKVSFRFANSVQADGIVPMEGVSNFFRQRVRDGNIQVGASETRFEKVRAPGEPARLLRIRLTAERNICHAVIDDVTPPPDMVGTPTDRMKQVGLTPDGKLLDRSHIE